MINTLLNLEMQWEHLHTTELYTGIIINQLKILRDDNTASAGRVKIKHALSFT